MINLEVYIPFLANTKLKQEEFLLMFCLYRLNYCDISTKASTLKLMKQYTDECGIEEEGVKRMTSSDTKNSLQDKGYLTITGSGVTLKELQLTDKARRVFCNEHTAGIEFLNLYPSRADIKGVLIPLKTSDRAVMARLYCNRIHYSATEHAKVMDDLRYGIDADLINLSVENFIRSEQWRDFRKDRLSLSSNPTQRTISNDF